MYGACGQRAATQRHRWAQAYQRVVASTFRGGGGATAKDKSENDLRMSQTRPGRRAVTWNLADRAWPTVGVKLELRRLDQASARDSNVARVGLGAAGSARPGRAPLAGVGSTHKNRWIRDIGFFTI